MTKRRSSLRAKPRITEAQFNRLFKRVFAERDARISKNVIGTSPAVRVRRWQPCELPLGKRQAR